MNPKNFLLYYKKTVSKEHYKIIHAIEKVFYQRKITPIFIERGRCDKKRLEAYDVIVSVGGDGTLLRASHFAHNAAVFGINSNIKTSQGVLCSATRHDLKEKILRIIEGKFSVKKFTRARVTLLNTGRSYDALNEIYIGSAVSYHTSRYVLRFGKTKEEQKSSGIIVSTGAGSTAWYRSAGKEKFNRKRKS
jgi:NAD+ kinase